jgi:hypothetical protein
MKITKCTVSAVLGVAFALMEHYEAKAASATTSTTTTQTYTSAGDSIKEGDEIRLSADAPIFYSLMDGEKKRAFCIPAGSRFHINHIEAPSSKLTAKDNNQKPVNAKGTSTTKADGSTETTITGASSVTQQTSDTTLYVYVPSRDVSSHWSPLYWWRTFFPPLKGQCAQNSLQQQPAPPKIVSSTAGTGASRENGETQEGATVSAASSTNSALAVGDQRSVGDESDNSSGTQAKSTAEAAVARTEYSVSATDLQRYGSVRSGFTWGALVIPYKFETSDHSFQAVPTTAAYVGYEGWWPGVSVAHVIAAGLGASGSAQQTSSSGNLSSPTSSTSSGGTHASYTLAVGEMATLGGAFKAGVLVGWDWQGSNSGFKYEGKTWVAISVGAGF